MLLRMAGKKQLMPLAVEPQRRWWMNVTWNKWNLSSNICTVFHALPSVFSSCDYWLFSCVKECLRGKQSESEVDTNTAVTVCLYLSKDEFRAAFNHLPHRWEKWVDSAVDYIDYRTYMSTFRNISSDVILYFVFIIKSYTKLWSDLFLWTAPEYKCDLYGLCTTPSLSVCNCWL